MGAYERFVTFLRLELDDVPQDELSDLLAEVRDQLHPDPLLPQGPADQPVPAGPRPEAHSTADQEDSTTPSVSGWQLLAAGALLGIVFSPLVWSFFSEAVRSEDAPEEGSAVWVQSRAPGGEFVLSSGKFSGDTLRILRDHSRMGKNVLISPDGQHLAYHMLEPDGKALYLRSFKTGEERRITDRSDDEWPLDWSPDGRYLLYAFGRAINGAAEYRVGVALYDTRDGTHRVLEGVELPEVHDEPLTAWSPLGMSVAVGMRTGTREGDGVDLYLIDPRGEIIERLTTGSGIEGSPAWSPDGREVAFVSHQNGTSDVYIVNRDGSNVRRLTHSPQKESSPFWYSNDEVGFLRHQPAGTELRVMNLKSGHTREAGMPQGEVTAVDRAWPVEHQGWVETVRIQDPPRLVTPGEQIELDVSIATATDRTLDFSSANLSHTSSDSSLLQPEGKRLFRVQGTGTAQLTAAAPGWRADTVEVRSVSLVERHPEPSFEEDWTQGLDPARWAVYGEPPPYARTSGGPMDGGVFVNNGDNHYESGVVSRRTFSRRNGITVEFWAKAPFTGRHYEDLRVQLQGALPPRDADRREAWDGEGPRTILEFRGQRGVVHISGHNPGTAVVLPLPEGVDRWMLYTLQLGPDGTMTVLVDDKVLWRRDRYAPEDLPDRLRVSLDGNAYRTEIFHGPLKVYEGRRWILDGPNSGQRTIDGT